jgi:hypothetical protein
MMHVDASEPPQPGPRGVGNNGGEIDRQVERLRLQAIDQLQGISWAFTIARSASTMSLLSTMVTTAR